jgi:hypothetical protein
VGYKRTLLRLFLEEIVVCRAACAKPEASKVDLIIVGDKGRNTFSSLLVEALLRSF